MSRRFSLVSHPEVAHLMIWCIEVALLSARSNFLITFVVGLCLATVALSFRLQARDRNLAIGIAVLLMVASVALASYCLPDRNSLVNLLKNDKFATLLGGLSGLLAGLAIVQPETRGLLHRLSAFALCLAIVGVCSLFLVKDASRSGPWGGTGQPSAPRPGTPGAGRVKIEEFASLDLTPICMAMDPDGRLYVSGLQGNVNAEGVIVRLERPESGGAVTSRTVARGLVRPHGMAFHEGSLYVVRTGQLTTTEGDRIKFVPTGVVTRLTDVDGDGEYDLYRDVLTGLPGAFGLHSVSAITFDDQGYMYVTTPTAGDHSPPLDSKEGQLLRCRPDGSGLTTLARGLRNPYDMIIGPDRQLFCTDNDADELNRGDVIYLVREGDHFGFPYDQLIGGAKVEGITPPIFAPGQGKVLEGLAYAAPGTLPAGYDDCLYVAVLWSDEVLKLGLRKTAEAPGYKAEVLESLPKISRPLDLIVAPREQAIYVLRGYEDKKIDRIVIQ